MKILYLFIFFVFIILMVSFASAGFFEDLYNSLTGKVTETNISITVSGVNPVTIEVHNETIITPQPNDDTILDIEFWVTVSDADGVADINDSSVNASFEFISAGEATRSNSSCVLDGDIPPNSANFTCTITTWYFDSLGFWNITVFANDLGNKTPQVNNSQSFKLNILTAFKISPEALTWDPVSPGDTNQTSIDDPTLINNTGNYNVTSTNLKINATNLVGATIPTDFIFTANFSLNIENSTGTNNETCAGSTMTIPVNNTETTLVNAILPKGNHSPNYQNATSAQEQIYYCIVEVPSIISSQTYTTEIATGYGPWAIIVT